mmetsp:Transcript_85559/g.242648  ORF Transcript_85559/g.242648 Transcript_85559/m.242648 type:complete len:160 (-) Transcript_85559:94-573(-)
MRYDTYFSFCSAQCFWTSGLLVQDMVYDEQALGTGGRSPPSVFIPLAGGHAVLTFLLGLWTLREHDLHWVPGVDRFISRRARAMEACPMLNFRFLQLLAILYTTFGVFTRVAEAKGIAFFWYAAIFLAFLGIHAAYIVVFLFHCARDLLGRGAKGEKEA